MSCAHCHAELPEDDELDEIAAVRQSLEKEQAGLLKSSIFTDSHFARLEKIEQELDKLLAREAEILADLGFAFAEEDAELEQEVYDFTHAETLVYLYADPHGGDPMELEVEDPETLSIALDGSHEITDLAGVGVIMPAGWLQITVYPNDDCKAFPR